MANEKKIRGALSAAKTDKSEIKVTAIAGESEVSSQILHISVRRLGLMAGQISVPDDFDRMGSEEIERIF